jgi:hypothetical protein
MRRILHAALAVFSVAGCAVYGQSWYRPGATEAQFEAAAEGCDSAATTRFPPMTAGRAGYYSAPNEWCQPTAGGTNCLIIGSGYLPQAQSAADTNEAPRARAFQACMVAGGWQPATPANGFIFTPSVRVRQSQVQEGSVGPALTYCEALFKGTENTPRRTSQFHDCVISRARELSVPRPPA